MTIRLALESDAAAFSRLVTELATPCGLEDAQARLRAILSDPERHWLGVAVAEGTVVGLCHVCTLPIIERTGLTAQLMGLVVDPGYRRRGAGRELVTAGEHWARARGCVGVYLRTNIKRPDAPPFYESLGYANTKTQHAFRKLL